MPTRAALLRHPLAIVGVVTSTVSAVVFASLFIAVAVGLFQNPYAGIVVVIALPGLFVFGVLLTLAGMRLQRRKIERNPGSVEDWPVLDFRLQAVRRWVLYVAALSAVSSVLLLLVGYETLHSMESPKFCGQACHTPMHPQFAAWQVAPHSNVTCTECHVGDNARATLYYKLAGVRQLVHVMSGNFPRPIPASQAVLQPALETCGTCHTPTLGHRERTRTIREYAEDDKNTETATTLTMHVGGPGQKTSSGRAIHWHADPKVRIEYITTDADRQTIPFVRAIDEKGETTEYVVEGTQPETLAAGTTRTMDCIDCHNAAAHRISPTAEQAVNRALAAGRINPALPFVRREAVRLLKRDYSDEAAASAAIESGFRAVYAASKPSVDQAALSQAIAATQHLYRTNVFPVMKVTWGVYRDNLGHMTSDGCFRCHDGNHIARGGKAISADCSYCHDQK